MISDRAPIRNQESHRLCAGFDVMAHRSMPQPDAAGKVSPVKRTSLSVVLFEAQPSNTASSRMKKSSPQYWEFAFAIFIMFAVLLLGWRIGKIVWETNPAIHTVIPAQPVTMQEARHPTSTKNSAEAIPARKAAASARVADSFAAAKEISSGPVVVHALVGIDGKVKEAKVVRGNSALAQAALQTVRQLNFTPYAPQGTPVEFETEVVVSQFRNHEHAGQQIQISVPQQNPSQQTTTP